MSKFASKSSVAALVPAWQSADFIQATLDCLSAQTHVNLEVIVSVDLCDDGTYEVCLAHAARDPRFRVSRQDRRLGYVGNCNFLLEQARADYVLFAFHDDVVAPDYVERLAALLDARPEVVLSYSDVLLTDVDGRQEHWEFTALEGLEHPVQRGHLMFRGVNKWWVPNRGLFRLARARGIGGLKTHGAGEFSADWPWLFHMSLLGQFARVPATLCHKFYKPGSLSRSWEHSKRQRLEARAALMRELWSSELSTREKIALAGPWTHWLFERQKEL